MEISKCFLFAFLSGFAFSIVPVVDAQPADQSGFISIDCGIGEGVNYTDGTTEIYYTSDANFVDGGLSMSIQPAYKSNSLEQQFFNVRSFPEGIRNCYTLKPPNGKGYKYLIRASFMYGNYDSKSQLPIFDMYLGVDIWETVNLTEISTVKRREIIHIPLSDYIHVCLVNKGLGIPFISSLELRLLNSTNGAYTTTYGSLKLYARVYFTSITKQEVRYKDDMYDRIWRPFNLENTTTLISTNLLDIDYNIYQVPSGVMRTAVTPQNASEPLSFYWVTGNSSDQFYVYLHFSEVLDLKANQSREFNIYMNGDLWYRAGPLVPPYLAEYTIYSTSASSGQLKYDVSLHKTINSTLPPIINAVEVYSMRQFSSLETDEKDVAAMWSIKSMYEVTRNWQGDPCAPQSFVWNGLNCSYGLHDPPRIISLNLSSSGLTGEIARYISSLTMIQSLDLSYNNLTGGVPDFLAQLASLRVLNLKGNNFTGSVPSQLLAKSNNGLLLLSFDGPSNNTNPCNSVRCNHGKNKVVVPIVASVVPISLVLLTALLILWMIKRRKPQLIKKVDAESNKKDGSFEKKNRQFPYSEVLRITNNFQRVIGKGGFGTVYHGYIDDTQVAVKMLSPSSIQGYKEFQAEANLLMSVHHKNLTSLVGYCNEGTNMGIIYEYMANGNLEGHLSGKNSHVLSWSDRLQIAMDAAQGLAYLHHGCKPPIIHRDIKSTNILLNEKFQAKLADFGLSRFFPVESGTHLSTIVAGTPGYLDPKCYTTNRLTEKSDVYSFGIVLLEIITGRPAIAKNHGKTHISQWVASMLAKGDVRNIVDPRLRGDFEVNSLWKVVELAMDSVSPTSTKRPTMNQVVMELQCLETDIAFHGTESMDSTRVVLLNVETEFNPLAR